MSEQLFVPINSMLTLETQGILERIIATIGSQKQFPKKYKYGIISKREIHSVILIKEKKPIPLIKIGL